MAGCPPPRAGQPLFHPLGLTGVLMLAGAMVPFRLIPALLARPDAERGTWRRFLTSPGVLCFGALSLSLALSYLI